MRKFFNSAESSRIQKEKNRLRSRRSRRIERQKVLRKLKPEIQRVSAADKIAEHLATLVTNKFKTD